MTAHVSANWPTAMYSAKDRRNEKPLRRAPSLKALRNDFPSVDVTNLKRVREAIQHGREHETVMANINRLLEMHGVECIEGKRSTNLCYGSPVALYCNSGDTYNATILYVFETDTYRLSTYGDFVEVWERRHSKLL